MVLFKIILLFLAAFTIIETVDFWLRQTRVFVYQHPEERILQRKALEIDRVNNKTIIQLGLAIKFMDERAKELKIVFSKEAIKAVRGTNILFMNGDSLILETVDDNISTIFLKVK